MPSRPVAFPLIFLLLAIGLGGLPATASSRKPKPPPGDQDKPKLVLTADPAFGFTPVTVVLTGSLTGIGPLDRNFCHAAVSWVRIDPGQTERDAFRTREDPACVHPEEEISVITSFTRTLVLYRPGSYLIRLEVEGKDGTRVVSPFTRVEVLRIQ
ncbi:MAG: hypothetical protein HYS34_08170 [Acidobacteria bacterium]|nr:hypothetical protein [Acidobacteriota bacterium]